MLDSPHPIERGASWSNAQNVDCWDSGTSGRYRLTRLLSRFGVVGHFLLTLPELDTIYMTVYRFAFKVRSRFSEKRWKRLWSEEFPYWMPLPRAAILGYQMLWPLLGKNVPARNSLNGNRGHLPRSTGR